MYSDGGENQHASASEKDAEEDQPAPTGADAVRAHEERSNAVFEGFDSRGLFFVRWLRHFFVLRSCEFRVRREKHALNGARLRIIREVARGDCALFFTAWRARAFARLRRLSAADRIDNLRESNRVTLCRAGFDAF